MCKLTHCRSACPHGNFTHFALCSTAEAGLQESNDFEPLSPVYKQAHSQVWPENIWFNRRLRTDTRSVFADCWRRGGLRHSTNLTAHTCPECWVHSRLMKGISDDCQDTNRCGTCDDTSWQGSFFLHMDCPLIWPTLAESMRTILPEDDPRLMDVEAHALPHGAPWWCELDDRFDFDYSRDGWQRHAESLGWFRLSTPKRRTRLERDAVMQPRTIIGGLDGTRRGPPPPMLKFSCKDRGMMNPMAVLAGIYEHEAMERGCERECERELELEQEQQTYKDAEPQIVRDGGLSVEKLDALAAHCEGKSTTLPVPCLCAPESVSSSVDAEGETASEEEKEEKEEQEEQEEQKSDKKEEIQKSGDDDEGEDEDEDEDVVMTTEEEENLEARALENVINASVAEACGFTEDFADLMDLDDDFVC